MACDPINQMCDLDLLRASLPNYLRPERAHVLRLADTGETIIKASLVSLEMCHTCWSFVGLYLGVKLRRRVEE